MREPHDPIPDGKTGPFGRKPHLRKMVNGVPVFDYDPRCELCSGSQLSKVLDAGTPGFHEELYRLIGLIPPERAAPKGDVYTEYEAEQERGREV